MFGHAKIINFENEEFILRTVTIIRSSCICDQFLVEHAQGEYLITQPVLSLIS